MDLHFPNEGWDKVIHDYILIIKEDTEAHPAWDLSLYTGLAGLASAVHFASHRGARYQKMLSTLDAIFMREVPFVYLKQMDHYLNPEKPIHPNYYNLSFGLSGIIAYCMSRHDSMELRSLAHDCLNCLVRILLESKEIHKEHVPAWYIAPEQDAIFESKGEGGFKLDMPNGLLGVLAVLSLAKIKGLHTNGLNELISKMADWVKNKQILHDGQINWNHLVMINEELEGKQRVANMQHHAWFCGSPGTLYSLYLASKAMKNANLAKFVEQTMLSQLRNPPSKNQIEDTSFCFGHAGLLAIASEMARNTHHPEFFKCTRLFEEEVKQLHHPNHEFGFQTLLQNGQKTLEWSHNPSLMNGAVGIGLTLLQVQEKQEIDWICPLVLA
jgi:hypothetical protein